MQLDNNHPNKNISRAVYLLIHTIRGIPEAEYTAEENQAWSAKQSEEAVEYAREEELSKLSKCFFLCFAIPVIIWRRL